MGKNDPWVKVQGQRPTAGSPLHVSGEEIVSGSIHRHSVGRHLDILSEHDSNTDSICKPSC